jgi:hypothetical protein
MKTKFLLSLLTIAITFSSLTSCGAMSEYSAIRKYLYEIVGGQYIKDYSTGKYLYEIVGGQYIKDYGTGKYLYEIVGGQYIKDY